MTAPPPPGASLDTLNGQNEFALRYLGLELAALDAEQRAAIEALASHRVTSRDSSEVADEQETFGDGLADRVAAVGGSWGFIITFAAMLIGWMILNSGMLRQFGNAFDPYPFIFLNLILSTVAALQAPVIMMSQNRQGAKDRVTASHDYEVNLRAELEIARLHHRLASIEEHLAALRRD